MTPAADCIDNCSS